MRVSVWLSGVPVHGRVTPPHRPSIRFLFVGSGLCLRLPSHSASRRRSCLQLTVPANRPVEDSHLLDQRHAWHTIPRDDVDAVAISRTDHHSHCPFKGDASYFTLTGGGVTVENGAWSYEQPYPAADAIRGHRVDSDLAGALA